MTHSESIKEIATALAKAQGALKHAVFDSKNPHFKNEYASLSSYIDAARLPLTDNSLAITQTLKISPAGPILITTLMHASGEWLAGEMPLFVSKNDMQGLGSAITYARRYGFAAILGMTQDDDDANGSVGNQPSFLTQLNGQPLVPLEQMLKAFAKFNVSKFDIQKYFAVKDLSELSGAEIGQLREIGNKMKSGQLKKDEVFK